MAEAGLNAGCWFWKWKELGRSVKKDAKGICIIDPIVRDQAKKSHQQCTDHEWNGVRSTEKRRAKERSTGRRIGFLDLLRTITGFEKTIQEWVAVRAPSDNREVPWSSRDSQGEEDDG